MRRAPNGPEDLSNALRCISWGVPKIAGNVQLHEPSGNLPGTRLRGAAQRSESRGARDPDQQRPHLAESLRQWNGDSRGHWEGNTLVIETTNFSRRASSWARQKAAPGRALHADGPRTLDYQLTIDDPTTWTTPWTALIRLKASDEPMIEFACHEGNHHVVRRILGGARAEEK